MTVGTIVFPDISPIQGVRLAAISAGIYKKSRPDLILVELSPGTEWAAMYTRNAFCAAPVQLAKTHSMENKPRFLLINAGNANAGTGSRGLADAKSCCEAVARLCGVRTQEVLPFSTGVIGEYLPVPKIAAALPALYNDLNAQSWPQVGRALMTTDTVPKGVYREIRLPSGATVKLAGLAKGSGMIRPDMATMLAYLFTDAGLDAARLQLALREAVEMSFHSISVDGDTSTNDSIGLAATGLAARLESAADIAAFQSALNSACLELAQMIVRDGEGATKLISIDVAQGRSREECRQVAFTIAHSPLVMTAFFASDPNWGRILAAIGRAGLPQLAIDKVTVYLDDVCIVQNGERAVDYTEEVGKKVMQRAEIAVRVLLDRGTAHACVWTCDLSHEYVRINAEYRS